MKKTKYDSSQNYLAGFWFYLLFGLILMTTTYFGASFAMKIFDFEDAKLFKIIFSLLQYYNILLIGPIFFIPAFRMLVGYLKGKKEINRIEREIVLANPYIYYRELPNHFGIGVNTLLIDSEIENEKDIVATILDLCAKGYLKLVKEQAGYKVIILKPGDTTLLSNEQYILELIVNHNLQNVDYNKWYQYCMSDGIKLGLFEKRNIVYSKKLVNRYPGNDKLINIVGIVSIIIGILTGIISYVTKFHIENLHLFPSEMQMDYMFSSILFAVISFSVIFLGFTLIYSVYIMTKKATDFGKQLGSMSYKHTLMNQLVKTERGKEEVKKLYAFRMFIKDFGQFASKKPEEIVLWKYYLSYAQVFGLTKEIMNSGYSQLVKNSSFDIDNIDNITLNNMII